ncbi:MAG: hypothetical protein IVW51_04690 [Thermaceae bacterium]|nr:hypothetical protein [Thermaceae bacterium]
MQTYTVQVERQDSQHALALVRTFTLELGAKRADPQAGFNLVETLLSSFGTCLLTGLQFVAESSKIVIASVWIQLEATRLFVPSARIKQLFGVLIVLVTLYKIFHS